MYYKKDKYLYKRNLLISVVVSLCLLISLFYSVPSKQNNYVLPNYSEPILTLLDIPITKLTNEISLEPNIPSLALDLLTIDLPELLDDIEIKEHNNLEIIKAEQNYITKAYNNKVYESSAFPFVPRQLIEVVPQNVKQIKGFIRLKVLIGEDGFPKEYIVLEKSINSNTIIQSVTDALYKSRWQTISIDSSNVEYWIEKTYSFN